MDTPTPVYWDTLTHHGWTFHAAATEQGLCALSLPNETFDSLVHCVKRQVPGALLRRDASRVESFLAQLDDYLSGRLHTLNGPLDLRGAPFQTCVWEAVRCVPYGCTRSYSEIAAAIHRPTAVRAVARANGLNPVPIFVPCHRIIGKNGALTGYRGGIDLKAALLALEQSHRTVDDACPPVPFTTSRP